MFADAVDLLLRVQRIRICGDGNRGKKEKNGKSISLLYSFIDLQHSHSKAMGVALKILPTKDVADSYMTAQLACIDFIETVADGIIKTVENHSNKKNKQ